MRRMESPEIADAEITGGRMTAVVPEEEVVVVVLASWEASSSAFLLTVCLGVFSL